MTRFTVDIETDGLLDSVSRILCVGMLNCSTDVTVMFKEDQINEALSLLDTGDELILHNGIGFDLPALERVTGWTPKPTTLITDTLLWSQFLFSDLKNNDKRAYSLGEDDEDDDFDLVLGSHSLEAWGVRLGCPKTVYTGGWDVWTQELQDYCEQDLRVTEKLRRHLVSENRTNTAALATEHQFAKICQKMQERGIAFDVVKAQALHQQLQSEITVLENVIVSGIPPVINMLKTPAYWIADWVDAKHASLTTQFTTKGAADAYRKLHKIKPSQCSITAGPLREEIIPFNPNSRDQVRKYLFEKHGWTSPKLTETGEKLLETSSAAELAHEYGSLTEEILRDCRFPEGQQFADYYLLRKISSFLSSKDGEKGWLSLVKDDRIHGRIITIGAATLRCTHSRPNLSQTPHVSLDKATGLPLFGLRGRYGADCRELFIATEGYEMIGADLSSIELVCLAHYLFPYDHGAYAKQVLEGDVHMLSVNAIKSKAHYVVSRGDSKTCTFGWAYGSGDYKLGTIITAVSKEAYDDFVERRRRYLANPGRIHQKVWSKATNSRRSATPDEAAYMEVGSQVRTALETGIDGLGDLITALKEAAKKKYLNILKCQVPVRSAHAVLNTALQSCAAIIMKNWVCLTTATNESQGVEVHSLLNIHDEWDVECLPQYSQAHSDNCLKGMLGAGERLGIRVPVRGSVKCGRSWLEVH